MIPRWCLGWRAWSVPADILWLWEGGGFCLLITPLGGKLYSEECWDCNRGVCGRINWWPLQLWMCVFVSVCVCVCVFACVARAGWAFRLKTSLMRESGRYPLFNRCLRYRVLPYHWGESRKPLGTAPINLIGADRVDYGRPRLAWCPSGICSGFRQPVICRHKFLPRCRDTGFPESQQESKHWVTALMW